MIPAKRSARRRIMRMLALVMPVLMLLPGFSNSQPARTGGGPTSDAVSQVAVNAGWRLQEGTFVPGDLIVRLKGGVSLKAAAVAGVLERYELTASGEILPVVYRLTGEQGAGLDISEAAGALIATGAVEYAQPNRVYEVTRTPDDEQYVAGQQWSLSQIRAEQAWDITTGSTDIVVAILDTGVATDHPDLEDKIVPGYDFYNNDNEPYDDSGHGTMTAGITAASSNNSRGVSGVSWGARIMPVKVLGGQRGSGTDEMVARGIRWAVDNGARIINMSLGGEETSPVQDDAIRYAYEHNLLVVAAAGNTPDGKPHYPAAYDTVLSVGATGRSDTVTGFSSFGRYVDVSAPGVGILSTSWSEGNLTYEYGNGTSFSCPLASGAAALVWSVNPSLTADDVRFILEDSSDDVGPAGWDEYSGRGRLNVERALHMARQGKPPTRTSTPAGQVTATPVPQATRAPGTGTVIQVDSKRVAPGALLAILGSGFGPNEIVDLSLVTSGAVRGVGSAQTDGQGAFRGEIAIPRDQPLGDARLLAEGKTSRLTASVDLSVTTGGSSGQSAIRGTVRGAPPNEVTVRLKPALGVSGAELTTQTDANGQYTFASLTSGFYALSASAPGALPAGPFIVQVDGGAADVRIVDITMAVTKPEAFNRAPQVPNSTDQVFFLETGHGLNGPFIKFWRDNGGLAIFGYPISEEFAEVSPTDGKTYTVQYFERNRFEYHPEFAGSRNEVLMGLLGLEMTQGRTFPPGAAFPSTPTQAYFPETGHSLSGPFLRYWQAHGGLAIFGYPISEEVMENGYLVQYFERNRFEYHPEFAGTSNEVLLGLLGIEVARRNGWVE
jgi:subtilisin family serine protease